MTTKIPKYYAKLLDGESYPVILVWHDKHEPLYYLANNRDELCDAYLRILRRRMSPEYPYICRPDVEPYGLKNVTITQEQAESLPEPYRTQALQDINHNERLQRAHREELANWEQAKKALKDKNGDLAFVLLKGRNDYEYERITHHHPEKI